MELDESQINAYNLVIDNIKNKKQITKISGLAGTGKSFILSKVKEKYKSFCVCAYTGKAADNLRRRGIKDASTIHSSIYTPVEIDGKIVSFNLKSKGEIKNSFEGFLVDEGSMVPRWIHNDLISFGLPVIYFGDHGQLEPVGCDFNLMENSDIKLEKIHRNAGEIAHFSYWIRSGKNPLSYPVKEGKVEFTTKWKVNDEMLASTDQIICAYNKTRIELNNRVRKYLNRKDIVEEGEKIICLKNNRNLGVFNGQQGYATFIKKNTMIFDTGYEQLFLKFDPKQFGLESGLVKNDKKDICFFDYGYSITGHKVQSAEYPRVIIFEQICKHWDHKRWAYTVASRAKEFITWIPQ